jgi:hypothetical protein
VWFIQRYEPGDPVTVTVVNKAGEKRDLTYRLPLREK